jgi:hypothetical protein
MNPRWLACSFALFGWFSLGLGCSSGGGSEEGGSEFITVLQTSPEDRTPNAQVETRIGFQIDANIDTATLSNETFFVSDSEGTRVVGELSIGDEPSIAVLTPSEPLDVITDYTATITTGLRSTSGATLEAEYFWRFTTLDSEWGEPEWVETIGTGTSSEQDIAVDAQRNAIAVWEYDDESGKSIWANRYTRTELWGQPEAIDLGDGVASDPRLAVAADGSAFAVWVENAASGTAARIWSNRYAVDAGWGEPELVQTGEVTTAQNPAIAADPAGNAIAIWVQRDMVTSDLLVWANRYTPGSGWGTAELIDEAPVPVQFGLPTSTTVGMDAEGNAIAMWMRAAFPGDVLWSNRYTAGSGWGTAELIDSDETTSVRAARLSVGVGGDAFVIWIQREETAMRDDVWTTRFSGSSWEAPLRIDGFDDADTVEADIAVDGMGIAHAVWSQDDSRDGAVPNEFRNIWSSQYSPGSGWGSTELIEPPNEDPSEDDDATNPRVAVNEAGNAFVVWRQTFEDWGSIWSNRLDPSTGWIGAELIEDDVRAGKSPKIAVDNNRHAHALWLHSFSQGSDWVRTNRFE